MAKNSGQFSDPGQMINRVDALLRGLPGYLMPTLLVAPFRIPEAELDELLEMRLVAGCIVRGRAVSVPLPTVGSIRETGEWEFPGVRARSLTYLGWSRVIRPRRLFEAVRLGIYWVVSLDPFGQWQKTAVPSWYLSYLRMRWQQLPLMRKFDGDDLSGRMRTNSWSMQARKLLRQVQAVHNLSQIGNKILMVTGSLSAGGAERQVLNTAISLARAGQHIEVLCFYAGRREFDFYLRRLDQHVSVQTFDDLSEILIRNRDARFEPMRERLQQPNFKRFMNLVPHALREAVVMTTNTFILTRPAVVHLWQDETNIVGGLAGLLADVPRIVLGGRNLAPYHFSYHRRYLRPIYELLLSFQQVRLVNNSLAGARSYAEWLGIPLCEIAVIHNGIDTAGFRPLDGGVAAMRRGWNISDAAPLVGGVFRFSPEKDPLLWLQTAANVVAQTPGVQFVLVGEGEMRTDIAAKIRELKLEDFVHMTGLLDDIPTAMAAFDLLLLASREEGLPNVLLEAQLIGCPVVTTDAGGCAETVRDGETGWVVKQRSADALAERVCAVLADEDWRVRARDAAPRHIQNSFGLERMMKDTLRAYGLVEE